MEKNLFIKELLKKDKEIDMLKKDIRILNDKLSAVENYRIEYESLIIKLKQTQNYYEKRLKTFNNLESEYRKQLESVINDFK